MTERLQDEEALAAWLRVPRAAPPAGVLQEAFARLNAERTELLQRFRDCSGYAPGDAETLWADQDLYLRHLLASPGPRTAVVEGARDRTQLLTEAPIGRVLVCLPANAPVPLAAICALCAVAGGNRVVFTRPRHTSSLVDGVLDTLGLDAVAIFSGSPRLLVGPALELFDSVYFMGPSSAHPGVAAAAAAAGCDLVFEGQGNGFCLVSETLDPDGLAGSVDQLLRSKAFCNGQMCSAPNTILVAERFVDEFEDLWVQRAPSFRVPELGGMLSAESREWLGSGDRRFPVPLDDILDATHPVVVRVDADDLPPVEFFCPIAAVVATSDARALQMMGELRYRLQASVFAGDPEVAKAASALGYARVTSGFCPADQDPLAPWGNFGASGYSDVRTFREKFVRRQLLEVAP